MSGVRYPMTSGFILSCKNMALELKNLDESEKHKQTMEGENVDVRTKETLSDNTTTISSETERPT